MTAVSLAACADAQARLDGDAAPRRGDQALADQFMLLCQAADDARLRDELERERLAWLDAHDATCEGDPDCWHFG